MNNLLDIKKELEESNDIAKRGETKVVVDGDFITIDSMGVQTAFFRSDFNNMSLSRCIRIVRSTIYALAEEKQLLVTSSTTNEFE